jgi:tellurite resistance protein
MGFLLIIIIIVVVLYYIGKEDKPEYKSGSSRTKYVRSTTTTVDDYKMQTVGRQTESKGSFQFDVELSSDSFDGTRLTVFNFFVRGSMTYANVIPIFIKIDISDSKSKESDEPALILCMIESFCHGDTKLFSYISDALQSPYEHSMLNRAKLLSIPLEALVFPRKGQRRIEFEMRVFQGPNEIGSVIKSYSFYNPELGYIDKMEHLKEIDRIAVELACHISLIDGTFHAQERKVIRKWVLKKTNDDGKVDQEKRQELIDIMHDYVSQEPLEQASNKEKTYELCDKILHWGEESYKYDVLNLLISVINADGVLDTSEKELIFDIASRLGADMGRFRDIYTKSMPHELIKSSISDHELGLRQDMSISEKKQQLRYLYKKWSLKVTNSDRAVRIQAQEMLTVIADRRAQVNQENHVTKDVSSDTMDETNEQKTENIGLNGMRIAVAGRLSNYSREEVKEQIKVSGGEYVKLGQNVDYLVIGTNPGEQAERAKSLGVSVLTEEQFEDIIDEFEYA